MSLVVAIHNQDHIMIGADSLSSYTKDGKIHTPEDGDVIKVTTINPTLALTLTGTYRSDKRQFVQDFKEALVNVTDLNLAFHCLHEAALKSMRIHADEGFQMGLAGFAATGPSYRFIIREHGKDMGYVKDYPYRYYLSGVDGAVKYAEQRIKSANFTDDSTDEVIEKLLTEVIETCAKSHPSIDGPVVLTTLARE